MSNVYSNAQQGLSVVASAEASSGAYDCSGFSTDCDISQIRIHSEADPPRNSIYGRCASTHSSKTTRNTWREVLFQQPASRFAKVSNRGRTVYSDKQIAELENVFKHNPYPTSRIRHHLACTIYVPEEKVKIWFQNRRARGKKSKLDFAAASNSFSQSNNEIVSGKSSNRMKQRGESLLRNPVIPMSAILPLPTMASINASLWSNADCAHSWTSCGDTPVCGNTSQQQITCSQPGTDAVKTHCLCGWKDNCHGHVDSSNSTAVLHEPDSCSFVCGATNFSDCSAWKCSARSIAPDLNTQTSRIGIYDAGEGTTRSTQHEPDDYVLATDFNMPVLGSSPLLRQEQDSVSTPNESSNPPPIRRFVFPLHTLSDGLINPRAELPPTGALMCKATTTYGMGCSGFQREPPALTMEHFIDDCQPQSFAKRLSFCTGESSFQGDTELHASVQTQIATNAHERIARTFVNIPEIRENRFVSHHGDLVDAGIKVGQIDDEYSTDDAWECDEIANGGEAGGDMHPCAAGEWSEIRTNDLLGKAMEIPRD